MLRLLGETAMLTKAARRQRKRTWSGNAEDTMDPERSDTQVGEDPVARLERAFIAEYLDARGYDAERLQTLPEAQVHQLLKEASVYASAKLMEVEARARLVTDLHVGTPSGRTPAA
jgi:hypothetical protein